MDLPIEHDRAARRFHVTVDGYRCVLDYELGGGRMTIVYTGVPSEINAAPHGPSHIKAAPRGPQ